MEIFRKEGVGQLARGKPNDGPQGITNWLVAV